MAACGLACILDFAALTRKQPSPYQEVVLRWSPSPNDLFREEQQFAYYLLAGGFGKGLPEMANAANADNQAILRKCFRGSRKNRCEAQEIAVQCSQSL